MVHLQKTLQGWTSGGREKSKLDDFATEFEIQMGNKRLKLRLSSFPLQKGLCTLLGRVPAGNRKRNRVRRFLRKHEIVVDT